MLHSSSTVKSSSLRARSAYSAASRRTISAVSPADSKGGAQYSVIGHSGPGRAILQDEGLAPLIVNGNRPASVLPRSQLQDLLGERIDGDDLGHPEFAQVLGSDCIAPSGRDNLGYLSSLAKSLIVELGFRE